MGATRPGPTIDRRQAGRGERGLRRGWRAAAPGLPRSGEARLLPRAKAEVGAPLRTEGSARTHQMRRARPAHGAGDARKPHSRRRRSVETRRPPGDAALRGHPPTPSATSPLRSSTRRTDPLASEGGEFGRSTPRRRDMFPSYPCDSRRRCRRGRPRFKRTSGRTCRARAIRSKISTSSRRIVRQWRPRSETPARGDPDPSIPR